MPHEVDCYFIITGPGLDTFVPKFKEHMSALHDKGTIAEYPAKDSLLYIVSPHGEPMMPCHMAGLFSHSELMSVTIQCRWVHLGNNPDVTYGSWTMDSKGTRTESFYPEAGDSVSPVRGGRMVPGGKLLAFLEEWALAEEYV